MSGPKSKLETEIKLRIESADLGRRLLRRAGFSLIRKRVFEVNTVFDTPSGGLRRRGMLVRVRKAGARNTITFKGPPLAVRYKSRVEIESGIDDPVAAAGILKGLGFSPAFRYEKYRTEYAAADRAGVATLDETPIGDYLELEGPRRWIDRAARLLGFSSVDFITASYGRLYLDDCQARGVEPAHMVFR